MFARLAGIGTKILQHKGRSLLLVPLAFCAKEDACQQDVSPARANMGNNWMRAKSTYEFSYVDIDGNQQLMDKYKGKILVVLNVASDAEDTALTYKHLVAMHDKYGRAKDLCILAFPCDQFDKEPWCDDEIKEMASNFNVRFDMASKVEVNGTKAHPLFKFLRDKQGGYYCIITNKISSDFTKFVIDRQGRVVKRFAPDEDPYDIIPYLCSKNWFEEQVKKSADNKTNPGENCLARHNL